MTLEELPPVLVLHLKRFVFEKTGGCQKLTKHIDYPVDLEISKGTSPPLYKGLHGYSKKHLPQLQQGTGRQHIVPGFWGDIP